MSFIHGINLTIIPFSFVCTFKHIVCSFNFHEFFCGWLAIITFLNSFLSIRMYLKLAVLVKSVVETYALNVFKKWTGKLPKKSDYRLENLMNGNFIYTMRYLQHANSQLLLIKEKQKIKLWITTNLPRFLGESSFYFFKSCILTETKNFIKIFFSGNVLFLSKTIYIKIFKYYISRLIFIVKFS